MIRSCLGAFSVIAVLAGCSTPPPSVINIDENVQLNDEAQSQIRQMQRDGHFGAMAISAGGSWGWAAGYNSLTAARDDALVLCRSGIRPDDECFVALEVLPVGAAPQVEGIPVTLDTAAEFEDHAPRAGASAFAIAVDGTHGHGWGYDTVENAQIRALRECNSRNEARASERFEGLPIYPCEVIWTKSSDAM